MNEIKLIKEAFSFLPDNGYVVSVEKGNLEYCVTYSNIDKSIIVSYDLRLHQFDVGIQDTRNTEGHMSYTPLLEMDTGDKMQKKKLIDTLNMLKLEVEKDWTISKKHFEIIVNSYAEFVKNNLLSIMA